LFFPILFDQYKAGPSDVIRIARIIIKIGAASKTPKKRAKEISKKRFIKTFLGSYLACIAIILHFIHFSFAYITD